MGISRTTRTRITLHLRTCEARVVVKALEEFCQRPDLELSPAEWDALNETLRYAQGELDESTRLASVERERRRKRGDG